MGETMLKKITNWAIGALFFTSSLVIVTSCMQMQQMPQKAQAKLPKYGDKRNSGKNTHSAIIRLYREDGAFCTGFVIDGNYAMTAAHCIQGNPFQHSDFEIKDQDDLVTGVIAQSVGYDPERDVAFIKGNFEDFQAYAVDFVGNHIYTGMLMRSCGFPAGQKSAYCTNLILVGNYSFKYRTVGAPLFKGMSGGPVFSTADNYVIGINSGVLDNNVIVAPLVGALEEVGLR